MSTITAPTRTHVDSPANKVIREYAIVPSTVNGHRVADALSVRLRYSEAQIATLRRDSAQAHDEALDFARRRGMLPQGVSADVVCVLESLRRA